MITAPFLLSRLLNTPLLCDRPTASAALAFIGDRGAISGLVDGENVVELAQLRTETEGRARPYREYRIENGVAHVPVIGSLVSRSSSLRPPSGMSGYSAVRQVLETALADDAVQGVLLEIDSGGGEAAGALELARFVREAAIVKPLWAVVNELSASAAYAIASGAEKILAPRTGRIGSIGALALLEDRSGSLKKQGKVVHVVRSASRKARPSGLEAVTDADLNSLQAFVDGLHVEFVSLVAEHRELSADVINSTEGAVLSAVEALEIGLIDAIMSVAEARLAFEQYLATGTVPTSTHSESIPMPTFARPGAAAGTPSPSALGNLGADVMAQVRQEMAARFSAITGSAEAAGLAELAGFLAMSTDLPADQAKQVLVLAAKTRRQTTDFAKRMGEIENPDVGPDAHVVEDEAHLDTLLDDMRRLEGRDRNAPSLRDPK